VHQRVHASYFSSAARLNQVIAVCCEHIQGFVCTSFDLYQSKQPLASAIAVQTAIFLIAMQAVQTAVAQNPVRNSAYRAE
jgi:hypothetical protein